MTLSKAYQKETIHLWMAIAILLALVLYRIFVLIYCSVAVPSAPVPFAVSDWIYNISTTVILILLWKAYRRWIITIRRRRELEFVIRGIGPDLLIVIDQQRRIVMSNDAVETMFGYTVKEVIGKTTDLLYFDRRITGERHEIYNHIQKVGFHTGFAKGRRKDGRIIPLEIITGDLPHGPGAVILIRDITERKQAESQLIKAKEAAEAANLKLRKMEHMRDSLTHMIVHDLKSPLTAISGYLELLSHFDGDKLSEKGAGFLAESIRLTNRLGEMINSMLDLRRLESDEMPLKREVCDLMDVLEEAAKFVRPDAVTKRINMNLPDSSLFAFCDHEVIRRVFVNLLGNAIKFTPEDGGITVGFEDHGKTVKVLVRDTGQGIPEQYHEKIFDRFAQLDAKAFSSGLGLAFCKLAIEAHNGKIGVKSVVGDGSTFWFVLPTSPEDINDSVADIQK